MVVPEIVGLVGEKLDRQNATASEGQKAGGGGAESDDHPKSALHRFAPFFGSDSGVRKTMRQWNRK
jgi:hypothetical protein